MAVPLINQNPTPVAGIPLTVLAYANPAMFPAGMSIVLGVPGQVAPLGTGNLAPGVMLCALPAEVAAHMLKELGPAIAKVPPGQPRPIGF